MEKRDIVIITHLPAFYKSNLYNQLCLEKNILVIFIGNASAGREDDFTGKDLRFPYVFINTVPFEKRSKLTSCLRLLKLLYSMRYRYLVVNGWDLPEFWAAVLLTLRGRKGVVVESTIFESGASGTKAQVKRLFLSFIHFALPSGIPHVALLKKLRFNKPFQIVGGVGIPLKTLRQTRSIDDSPKRYLYVGRLVPEKNLAFLIRYFNGSPDRSLTIAGNGILEGELKELANSNISFAGYVANKELVRCYASHHALILPSVAEPWGLVVEEALQNGMPVIVSDAVGSSQDVVLELGAGEVFASNDEGSLAEAMNSLNSRYATVCDNIARIDFGKFYRRQVDAYLLNWLNAGDNDD